MKLISTKIFLFLFILSAQSQVVIYDKATKSAPVKSVSTDYLRIKVDLWEPFICGTLKAYVEKNITDHFSIEVGAGMTHFSVLNLANLSNENGIFVKAISTNGSTSVDYPRTYKSTGYTYKPGYAVSIFPRYYIDDNDDGSFIGIEAEYKRYNLGAPSTIGNGTRSQHLSFMNFSLNYGGANLNDNDTHTDYLIGIGMSMVDDVRFTTADETSTVTYTALRPLINFGIRWSFLQF